MHRIVALPFAAFALLAAAPPTELLVEITGLRNARGLIHACLTQNPHHFPDCKKDPARIEQTVPASAPRLRFSGFPPGRYALSLIHDENSNRKLDTVMGMPKEGFGFSRSPVVRFGPPKFDKVAIDLAAGSTRTSVRMQYLL